jgi:hypothetical protein
MNHTDRGFISFVINIKYILNYLGTSLIQVGLSDFLDYRIPTKVHFKLGFCSGVLQF